MFHNAFKPEHKKLALPLAGESFTGTKRLRAIERTTDPVNHPVAIIENFCYTLHCISFLGSGMVPCPIHELGAYVTFFVFFNASSFFRQNAGRIHEDFRLRRMSFDSQREDEKMNTFIDLFENNVRDHRDHIAVADPATGIRLT